MYAFFILDENLFFSIAITIMFGIALLEGISLLLGFALSGILESILPDLDFETDFTAEFEAQNSLSKMLAWLRVGKVPVLMLLVIFLTSFGLIGLFLQLTLNSTLGFLLPAWLASIPAFFMSLPMVRLSAGVIQKVLPNDETDAVSIDTFIGRIATLTIASASKGHPAEAKLKDQHGKTHYVMLEPDDDSILEKRSKVLIIKKEGSVFKAIKNNNTLLTDD